MFPIIGWNELFFSDRSIRSSRNSQSSNDDIRWRQHHDDKLLLPQNSWRWREMTDDHWWITSLSINWILAQKPLSRGANQITQTIGGRNPIYVRFLPADRPKKISTIGDLEVSEQCSTSLTSPVILIMLVKLLSSFCCCCGLSRHGEIPRFLFVPSLDNDNFRFNLRTKSMNENLSDWTNLETGSRSFLSPPLISTFFWRARRFR